MPNSRNLQFLLGLENAPGEEAEAARQAVVEILATISHELRTPLNAILGWSRLITAGNLEPAAMLRAVTVIERNARQQAELVENLLDISRMAAGDVALRLQSSPLTPILEGAAEPIRPAAAAKGIVIEIDTASAPPAIVCDPDRVRQIVRNLLSNSLKFTPAGGSIRVTAAGSDSGLTIAVTDTGMGIPADFLPFVFDRFRQEDRATTRSHGGLGLGLSIAKGLADLHGGSMTAESEGVGAGARFTVALPTRAAS